MSKKESLILEIPRSECPLSESVLQEIHDRMSLLEAYGSLPYLTPDITITIQGKSISVNTLIAFVQQLYHLRKAQSEDLDL